MPIDMNGWINKEVVVHIHSGILLNHKKEHICLSSNKVDEPRAYYTEWNKSEREKQTSHINAYTWNLEIKYWWTYVNGEAGTENRLVDMERVEREGGTNWESGTGTYTLPYVKSDSQREFAVWRRELKSGAQWQFLGVGCVGGGREVQEGGDVWIPMADSCCYLAETNTIL